MPMSSGPSNPQRVLACVLCQQRKVKCDRKFPCANCTKFRVQCVPATAPRRRKQRFPERELLDRIRKYEDLLRQNGIEFKPLHRDGDVGKGLESLNAEGNNGSEHEQSEPPAASGNPGHEPNNIWNVMRQSSHDAVSETGVRKAWDQIYPDNDNFFFGSRKTAIELFTFHPEPVQIFRLWQIYLNNVDPLLKVTHTHSLQGYIIEAAGDLVNISPTLEALMFGIYSASIMSLTTDECQVTFGSSKDDLLTRYQSGCQQALLNCGYLRTSDRECLTALYLFLLSIGCSTDPRSLFSMFGVAIRIAYRMGIHSELACVKHPPFEAEMRRRLWWSLRLLDTRINELADYKTVVLAPTWDCRIPLNVNDSDLRPEIKEPPSAQGTSSEALFVVVRSEVGEFVRRSRAHLDFASLPVAKDALQTEGSKLDALEKKIEDKYLRFCNPENPLHYMTIWMTRTYFAKNRLLEHYSRYSNSSTDLTDTQRDAALCHALNILLCDTKIMTSPLIKGYLWFTRFYFPFPAYMHILQDLRRRPVCKYAEEAWKVMSENFESRVIDPGQGGDSPFLNIFAKIVLPAWEAREAIPGKSGKLSIPKIVLFIRERMVRKAYDIQPANREQEHPVADMSMNNLPMSIPMGLGDYDFGLLYGAGGQDIYAGTSFDIPRHQLDCTTMDWGFGGLLI